jgi:hypothetical protein
MAIRKLLPDENLDDLIGGLRILPCKLQKTKVGWRSIHLKDWKSSTPTS